MRAGAMPFSPSVALCGMSKINLYEQRLWSISLVSCSVPTARDCLKYATFCCHPGARNAQWESGIPPALRCLIGRRVRSAAVLPQPRPTPLRHDGSVFANEGIRRTSLHHTSQSLPALSAYAHPELGAVCSGAAARARCGLRGPAEPSGLPGADAGTVPGFL